MGAGEDQAKARKQRQSYRCFLVRCRLEEGASPGAGGPGAVGLGWRFVVQQVGPNAARRSFTCLHDLAAYMDAELASFAVSAHSDDAAPGDATHSPTPPGQKEGHDD